MQREVAARFTVTTVRKWRDRDAVQDRSHRPNKRHTALVPRAGKAIVMELRRALCLPCLCTACSSSRASSASSIRAGASHAALLDGCLCRHSALRLREFQKQADKAPIHASKTFISDQSDFVHGDIKCRCRRCPIRLSDAICSWLSTASHGGWFAYISASQSEAICGDFLWRLHQGALMKMGRVLRDNGSQFIERFTAKGKHPAAHACACQVLREPGHQALLRQPQIHALQPHAMVERFNGRVTEVMAQTRPGLAAALQASFTHYVPTCHSWISQWALNHPSSIQAWKGWRKPNPELFMKRLHDPDKA